MNMQQILIIDTIYDPVMDATKPRTYRKNAGKEYLQTAQKRSPQHKTIRKITQSHDIQPNQAYLKWTSSNI